MARDTPYFFASCVGSSVTFSSLMVCFCSSVRLGLRPKCFPAALALLIPSSWRSLLRLISNSAKTPSICRNAFPAAVEVSMAWSRIYSDAPLVSRPLTMLVRSFKSLASRSSFQVTSLFPSCIDFNTPSSCSRPFLLVPYVVSSQKTAPGYLDLMAA